MALLAAGGVACSPAQRPASGPRPEVGAVVSTLFDAGSVYGAMGLLVAGPPLPFVATLNYVAGAMADSTLAELAFTVLPALFTICACDILLERAKANST